MNRILNRNEFAQNCALYVAFKLLDNPKGNRNHFAYWYAMKSIDRCDGNAYRIAERMCMHPEKAAFVLDQYYYWIFNEHPHREESPILPNIHNVVAIQQKGWVGNVFNRVSQCH